jgi:hypothetical protein
VAHDLPVFQHPPGRFHLWLLDNVSRCGSDFRGETGINGVPWIHAYALERGDLVKVTPPWETSARTCRVVGYVRRFDDEMADLVLVEIVFGNTEP